MFFNYRQKIWIIQCNTTLFYYASRTQQKLVSRWGVGKHVTIKYIYIYVSLKYKVCYDSVRSSRRHEGEEASLCLKSESNCAVFASQERLFQTVAPLYALQKICVWPWKCQISLDIPEIVMLVSLSFTKEFLSWGADRSLRILYKRVAFVWKRLVSRCSISS